MESEHGVRPQERRVTADAWPRIRMHHRSVDCGVAPYAHWALWVVLTAGCADAPTERTEPVRRDPSEVERAPTSAIDETTPGPEPAERPESADVEGPAELPVEVDDTVARDEHDPPTGAEIDLEESPPVDPTLRAAERLGPGPWTLDVELAATAGWIDVEGAEPYGVLATIDHQRRTFVLLEAPGGRPEYAALGGSEERRYALWLVRIGRRVIDGEEAVRREAAVRLYDRFAASDDFSDASCDVPTSLRARDLDADGEVEVTVLAAGADEPYEYAYCGVVAFLVGGDDLEVQARFSRQHRVEITGAGGDWTLHDDTTWVVRDVNVDGHPDLHVVQRWSARDFFMGDDVGDGTMPGEHRRGSDRREVDCIYDAPSDRWHCPPVDGYQLGSRLFFTPADVAEPRASDRRFRDPPWPAPLRDAPMP